MKRSGAPVSVGIILDGNRRWAKQKGLSTLEGHRVGLQQTLWQTALDARDLGIRHLIVFMFSTENWNRRPAEISYLMRLFKEIFKKQATDFVKEDVRVRFAGQRERFSQDLQRGMRKAESATKKGGRLTLWCCLSYGGRVEIVTAAQKAAASGEGITNESLERHLWTASIPDIDILIRTSGEMRTSGFLTWKSTYAELFFIDKYWPDFNKADFERVLAEYAMRERRMGR